MSHNTFGHLFRVTTWGESHGPALGCVVDGCPPGIALTEADIQVWLDKRRPGQGKFVTQRQEPDAVKILSGVFEDERTGGQVTTGTPISMIIENVDQRSRDYSDIATRLPPRPRRLRLFRQVRRARLSRRRAPVGARDRRAGRRRRHRAQDPGRGRHRARRPGPDRPARGRPRALGLGRDRTQPVLVPRRRRWSRSGRSTWRPSARPAPPPAPSSRSRRLGVPAGWGAPIYGKLDAELAARADVDQRRQGRGDRRRLRRRGAVAARRTPTRCAMGNDGSRRSSPTTPAASWAASPPASRSSRAWRSSRRRRS